MYRLKYRQTERQMVGQLCLSHLSDKVDSPDEGDEVEHHQTARIIVLGGLHLGQVQPLHCALEDTKFILSTTVSKTLVHRRNETQQALVPYCPG